jgi:hypothetical protein
MMTSYIFNCDKFTLTESGGLFFKGRREVAFNCSSAIVTSHILNLTCNRKAFLSTELPHNVFHALQREGLLREYTKFQKIINATKLCLMFFANFLANYLQRLPTPLHQSLIYAHSIVDIVVGCILSRKTFLVIPSKYVDKVVRYWAWITQPFLLIPIALINLVGVFIVFKGGNFVFFRALTGSEKVGCVAIVITFTLFHEFSHAAAAYYRLKSGGEIRLGRKVLVIPFLFARMDGINGLSPLDKCAISASGIILQVIATLGFYVVFKDIKIISSACRISLLFALLNLLPIARSDGYWMICDLLGYPLKVVTSVRGAKCSDLVYTVVFFFIIGLGSILLFS